ncbi:helix-turn-helix domain-containing GNAT family N-acetyltransferase [Actinokineospora terrae]|uniref:L-amino acid N-acyltransferase YncA n=1 Tax=Actinokineospora terrae TaxID=155974 RepID=A0A1H9MI57_9PSEU|nr:metalloregulator ArsR/SmtB family transcription factor [Actinokineospora terrae]SER23221.1 L-amino acid N-acyltransferase YncA [Actinokineospora terrae]
MKATIDGCLYTELVTLLPEQDADTYASWFACLADPTRVRLLHAVAAGTVAVGAPGEITVGALAEVVGVTQPTCSHHVRKLADAGFLRLRREGTATLVSINPACCTGLPHAADAVMGTIVTSACCPPDLPADVTVRPMTDADWRDVRRVYAEGIATGNATFETETPTRRTLDTKWLPDHRWIAEIDGAVAGWAAATLVSTRACYSGVAETSVYVSELHRGRGVGKTLLHHQTTAADAAGLWTLQTAIFPENRASIALHHAAGFRTVGVRERIAQHHGTWRNTALLERRSPDRPD